MTESATAGTTSILRTFSSDDIPRLTADERDAGHVPALRPDEEWARQLIELELSACAKQHDDGSQPGMFDLTVDLADGGTAAVEVTSAADPQSIALWKLVNADDDRWIDKRLRGRWTVHVRPGTSAKRLRAELPRLLEELEQRGIRGLLPRHRVADRLSAAGADLGVTRASQFGTDFDGSIYVSIEVDVGRRAGWSGRSASDAVEWVGRFLCSAQTADVRRKLGRSGFAERHVFLIVPPFAVAPFAVTSLLMGYGEPVATPSVPAEITHVWMASTWRTGPGWRWSPERGWRMFDKQNDT